MEVSRNAYYNWEKTKGQNGEKESRVLLREQIRLIFNRSRQIYGSYRIKKMLERERLFYSRSYVAILKFTVLFLSKIIYPKLLICNIGYKPMNIILLFLLQLLNCV